MLKFSRLDEAVLSQLLSQLCEDKTISEHLITTVASHTSSLSEKISNDYRDLNRILVRHEGVIRQRWLGKTVAERRDLLIQAWPNMPEKHRPDCTETNVWPDYAKLSDDLKKSRGTHNKRGLPSAHKIWPFINLEDLTKPISLLVYLNARGRNVPFTFTLLEDTFSPLAAMSLSQCDPGTPQYALRVSNEASPTLRVGIHLVDNTQGPLIRTESEIHVCPRNGLYKLYIQQKITAFLVACTKLILHDMDQDTLYCSAIQEEPPSSELELPSDLGSTSFADIYVVAPYRNRGCIDFLKLREYFEELYINAKDHISALREDPSYFADQFKDACEHSSGMIPDRSGKIDSQVEKKSFLIWTAARMITDGYIMLFLWRELYQLVDRLSKTPSQSQSGYFASLMGELSCGLDQVTERVYDMLRYATTSPQVREFYVREGNAITMQPHKVKSLDKVQLLASLDSIHMREGSNGVEGVALYLLLDGVTTIMREKSPTRDLVSPRVSELLSQMSVLRECAMQMWVWRGTPQGFSFHQCHAHSHDQLKDFYDWLNQLDHDNLPVHLVNPYTKKLNYPSNKAYNRSNVKTMRTAEKNLDKFWDHIDNEYQKKTGVGQHEAVYQCLAEHGAMQRTPPWEDTTKVKSIKPEPVETAYQPFSGSSHDKDLQITGAFDRLAIGEKTKTKTKGTPDAAMANLPPVPPVPAVEEETPRKVFTLDHRELGTMRTLFHVDHTNHSVPKVVKWNEFKRAMVQVGFAVEKLNGSIWQFTPGDTLQARRPILFHEPHPVSDIPYLMARRFGRRLARVYGWDADSFQEA
ncbi:hypothetical protein COCMIDRAFT_109140 [Bipolaris oryzae ATCC 44560]|uniref:Clr5 domain-containing protein n=1 Tax=Bipolaris oryzae ATCC 44560 TaxID=930090 RepID=W6YXN8_COCMI|nr:uncharacterized protein COCMIDRAFT_109140 [Bipolaris oryzae ATCC 44560]EUC40314.1 hypothetical protein COCMIDRAFT_109140 [Bipolaris oryzae ATCC 44560]